MSVLSYCYIRSVAAKSICSQVSSRRKIVFYCGCCSGSVGEWGGEEERSENIGMMNESVAGPWVARLQCFSRSLLIYVGDLYVCVTRIHTRTMCWHREVCWHFVFLRVALLFCAVCFIFLCMRVESFRLHAHVRSCFFVAILGVCVSLVCLYVPLCLLSSCPPRPSVSLFVRISFSVSSCPPPLTSCLVLSIVFVRRRLKSLKQLVAPPALSDSVPPRMDADTTPPHHLITSPDNCCRLLSVVCRCCNRRGGVLHRIGEFFTTRLGFFTRKKTRFGRKLAWPELKRA